MREIDQIRYSTVELEVISATDCVKDRLASYYHWGDLQALEQAKLVANRNEISLPEIDRWSRAEGKAKEFAEIKDALLE